MGGKKTNMTNEIKKRKLRIHALLMKLEEAQNEIEFNEYFKPPPLMITNTYNEYAAFKNNNKCGRENRRERRKRERKH